MIKKILKQKHGIILELALVFGAIFIIVGTSLLSWMVQENKLVSRKADKELALQIAEAGVNYYMWHLAHNESDYKDGHDGDSLNGNGNYGPYIHDYFDSTNKKIGEYALEITPPPPGSTIAVINSTGKTVNSPNTKRVLKVRIGKKSFADYSFLTHAPIWIGSGEATSGKTHSNSGIRFDDVAHAKITSAVPSYDCIAANSGCSSSPQPGIWGEGGPISFWEFPVAPIDFAGITVDLNSLKDEANDNGVYYNSQAKGFHITFKNDGTFDVKKVTNLQSNLWQWVDYEVDLGPPDYKWRKLPEQIQTEVFVANHPIPANGIIFIEDNVWVDGIVNGKVTLVSAKLPDPGDIISNDNKDIRINNNITYVARDGNHKLGLIAQRNIMVPRYAPTNLTIDAAMLAQKGHVYYRNYSSNLVKTHIEVYGSIITNMFWTWSYSTGLAIIEGYQTTNTIYDSTLGFYPPPYFPTTGGYIRLSWEEK